MSWERILKSVKGRTKIQDKEIDLDQFRQIPEILDRIIEDAENAEIYLKEIRKLPRPRYGLRLYIRQIKRLHKEGETEEVKLKAEELKKSVIKWISEMESGIEYMIKRRKYLDSQQGKDDRNFKRRMKNSVRASNRKTRYEE